MKSNKVIHVNFKRKRVQKGFFNRKNVFNAFIPLLLIFYILVLSVAGLIVILLG